MRSLDFSDNKFHGTSFWHLPDRNITALLIDKKINTNAPNSIPIFF